MIKTAYRRIRRYMPAAALWLFVSAVVAAALHVGFVLSPAFADFFNERIAAFFRGEIKIINAVYNTKHLMLRSFYNR